MSDLFDGCAELEDIDVSKWKFGKDINYGEIMIDNFDSTITAGSYYAVGDFFGYFNEFLEENNIYTLNMIPLENLKHQHHSRKILSHHVQPDYHQ